MLHKLFKKKQPKPEEAKTMIFEAQLGGYYTYKNEEGTWTIYRLLDFADNAVHCTLYREHFDHKPTLKEAQTAKPFIMHAPVHKATLFNSPNLTLLGGPLLTAEDLSGMVTYMEQTGYTAEQMEYVIGRIGSLQKAGKATLKLKKVGDNVTIEEQK